MPKRTKEFDQAAYWRDRVSGEMGLGQVGHRAMGEAYNRWIYQRRLDVLGALDEIEVSIDPQTRVLDLGCGSGFYVPFWQAAGVAELTGVDLSVQNIAKLQLRFPQYRFVSADLTKSNELSIGRFDLVTLFDVLYHIVDDAEAAAVIRFADQHLADGGTLLIFDHLLASDYRLRKHVRFRARGSFMRMLAEHHLEVAHEIPLFVFLQPPTLGFRAIDVLIASAYFAVGLVFKAIPSLGDLAGRLAYHLDAAFLKHGTRIRNQTMFAVRRVPGEITTGS